MEVLKSWKNVGAKDMTITITNPIPPEVTLFERGKSYLVFAYSEKGRLMAGRCDGTLELERAGDVIAELDKWEKQNRSTHRQE